MSKSMLDAALAYAEMGWFVVPLHTPTDDGGCNCGNPHCGNSAGKHPRVRDWDSQATTDPERIREWWTKWPDANIGIACGPSDLFVVDLDKGLSEEGLETWRDLKVEHRFNDDGALVNLTGSGGEQRIFSNGVHPALGNTVRKLGPGIDTRGHGGLFVAPPSLHYSGKRYVWDVGAHPRDKRPGALPEPLVQLLTSKGNNGSGKPARLSGERIPEGRRNDTLFRMAAQWRNQGFGEEELMEFLKVANGRCDPSLPLSERARIAKSVSRYSPGSLTLEEPPPQLPAEVTAEPAAKVKEQQATEPQVQGWPWRNLADAYKPKDRRRWLVKGLLPIPSLSIIYGTPGGLKTMLAQDLGICVAGDKPWLAPLPDDAKTKPFKVHVSRVLWVDMDNGLSRIERRFAAIGKTHGLSDDAPLGYVSFPSPPFFANNQEAIERLLHAIRGTDAKLVVIDNLGTISGGADENSSQMVSVMAGLRRLAEEGNCAIVVIHHKSKGTRERMGDSLRGHSSIEAAVDLALLVERDGEGETVTIKSTKTRDVPVDAFTALWTYEQDGDGELEEGRFFGMGRPDGTSSTRSRQAQAEICIMEHMKDHMNQTEIVNMVKEKGVAGRNSTLAALKALVKKNRLATEEGEGGTIHYYRVRPV